jgi:NDP-sugar pyrophosphorylase family protein
MVESPDVVVLCGGFGLRLRGLVGETPKPMAAICGRPFMELLLKQLRRHGFSRVILSVGYKHEVIREYFGDGAFGLDLVYSTEMSPLGTGGALRQALDHIVTDDVVVLNGDSYTNANLDALVANHRMSNSVATVVVIADSRPDAGSVVVHKNGKLKNFAEKRLVPDARYLSAGIYVLDKHLISDIPLGRKISLEEELFPQWLAEGQDIQTFVYDGQCIDIGTPERYQKAQEILNKVEMENIFKCEAQS